tara:strand:- start:50 stop:469 length:420 start_codon:yes stop_codon:yes gene_type:complete
MKKILGIVVLSLLWFNVGFADLINNWNSYERAYQSGHDHCTYKWMKIGNFTQNPKVFLDIEKCTYRADLEALRKFGWGPNTKQMMDLVHDKHVDLYNLAKEMSIAAISGDRGVQVERFFQYRDRELRNYFNRQKALASR